MSNTGEGAGLEEAEGARGARGLAPGLTAGGLLEGGTGPGVPAGVRWDDAWRALEGKGAWDAEAGAALLDTLVLREAEVLRAGDGGGDTLGAPGGALAAVTRAWTRARGRKREVVEARREQPWSTQETRSSR